MIELNKVHLADAKEFLQSLPENSVDLVITDPPYTKKFFYTYKYLADYCPRIMKEGGSLIAIVGHIYLLDILRFFESSDLTYRWVFCLDQTGPKPLVHFDVARAIRVGWKPLLWFTKGKCPKICLSDKIEGEGRDKDLHVWQQNQDFCKYYIQTLTKENDVVLDPFVGSGTVAVVCKTLRRNFYACDVDPAAVETANRRLAETKVMDFKKIEEF
jgi:DNA modification methylase